VPIDPEEEARWSIPSRPWNRLVRAGDREGPLFSSEDLIAALRWGHLEEGYRPFLHTLTDVPADAPDRMWPEDLLILIALVVEERRERIRKALNFSPEGLADAFERVRASLPGEGEEREPKAPPTPKRIERLVSAADDDGELFTADELFNALRRSCSEGDARELTADWTNGGIDTPGKAWTENVLLMIALTIPDRAERIRRHLGFSEERMASELAHARGFFRDAN
jgi:hypothetical protein